MARPDAADGAGPPKFADLKTRLVSALGVALLALACLWAGGLWITGLAMLAAGLMMAEWRAITAGALAHPVRGGVLFIAAVVCAPLAFALHGVVVALAGLGGLALAGMALDTGRGALSAGKWSVLGAVYIGLAALALVALRSVELFGFLSIIWAVLVVVAADVGGYFAGRLIGGPKLWPAVSPKKTWAGLGGGVVLAFVVGGLFSWATTGTYFYQVCLVSVVAAVVAQGGDLAESALKRHFDVKDSGTLIPGHGGLLDRLDGHMAAILLVALVTFSRGTPVFIW